MNKIQSQYHPVLNLDGSLQEIQLSELFKEYWENVSQIIRSQNWIYTQLSDKLLTNSNIHLFNAEDSVNEQVIQSFNSSNWKQNNKALIAEIFWPEWIIIRSSLQVVTVLEMSNINLDQVKNDKLYLNAISHHKNYQDFINWFCNDFYRWKFTSKMIESFFYRNIILDK